MLVNMIPLREDEKKNFSRPSGTPPSADNFDDHDRISNGISTDLVPTLLNMYDALYAKLSESAGEAYHNSDEDRPTDRPGTDASTPGTKAGGIHGSGCGSKERNGLGTDLVGTGNCELFIRESDSTDPGTGGLFSSTLNNSITNGLSNTGRLPEPQLENDYDIPEFVEKDSGSIESQSPRLPSPKVLPPASLNVRRYSSPLRASQVQSTGPSTVPSTVINNSTVPNSISGNTIPTTGVNSGTRSIPYRPVSTISSSSSSSSNSLPLGGPVGLTSYLASAESLEDQEAKDDPGPTSRRRDRGLKARREKVLKTGSGDSGVQCHIISLPMPPSIKPRYCDPNLGYMDKVVLEIVETEQIYVRDLREVIEGYLEHWRKNPEQGISQDAIESLFSNIEQIYDFNKDFLAELETCGTNPVAVAKCFVRNNLGFAIYSEYCTNYPRTVSLLTDLMREECSVRACRERQLFLGHTLPLGSYLLKPVQRVLKYHLLLGNIVKHFQQETEGYTHIWNALSAMTGIAHHINAMKRKHEHAVRVQEIQSLLYGWQGEDLTTFGELAAEGTFKMFGFKGLRHVFLFDKVLLLAKRKDENILMYKAHIMCSDLMLIESIPGEPLSFHVIPFDNPKCQYTLECRNMEQKREWTLQLKRVILENYSAAIPAHARQLVMELGQAKNNDVSGSEWKVGGRKGAHHAPEYLERRKDKRRASESGINARLRIRRSSRPRKTKEEKQSRSRSASRTRDSDEDDERKTSSISPGEKSRLRLPMWRRRSEPGVPRGRIGSPRSVESPQSPLPGEVFPTDTQGQEDGREAQDPGGTEQEQDSQVENPEMVCNGMYEDPCDGDDNEPVAGENLEQIVSQLLQHQLQMQQIILNKQRRSLVRKKKFQYETSDTETEETCRDPRPPLPTSPPPLLNPVGGSHPFPTDFPPQGDADGGLEWSSGRTSVCSSLQSVHRKGSNDSTTISRSGSDVGSRERCGSEVGSKGRLEADSESKEDRCGSNNGSIENCGSYIGPRSNFGSNSKSYNYDNLMDVWGPKIKQCRETLPRMAADEGLSSLNKLIVRRVHSFSSASVTSKEDLQRFTKTSNESLTSSVARENLETDHKGRPATIAVYDHSDLNSYGTEQGRGTSPTKGQNNSVNKDTCSLNVQAFDADSALSVHPEHRIYSKAFVNKGSLKKVLHKLGNPLSSLSNPSSPSKTVSEPSYSLSSLFIGGENENSLRKQSLVSSMARQCSKTLKERIKQLRTEDCDSYSVRSLTGSTSTGHTTPAAGSTVPVGGITVGYKQGSASIGARLAASCELSEYAVPVIRPKSELRPDSVLSSSSIWTSSSSSSSSKEARAGEVLEDVSLHNLEPCEMTGDSFYEKSFEAIESYLEEDMFRDSAIYSDPEDQSEGGRGTLSPKSSFRRGRNSPMQLRREFLASMSIDKLRLSPFGTSPESGSSCASTPSSGLSTLFAPLTAMSTTLTSVSNLSSPVKLVSSSLVPLSTSSPVISTAVTSMSTPCTPLPTYPTSIAPHSTPNTPLVPIPSSSPLYSPLSSPFHTSPLSNHFTSLSTPDSPLSAPTILIVPTNLKTPPKKVPPPVPAKPDSNRYRNKGLLVQQQLKALEELGKRGDLGLSSENPERCKSPVSLGPVSLRAKDGEEIMAKGWVKHVVGKLQQ